MAIILDGRKCAQTVHEECIEKVNELKKRQIVPKLAVILVGDDKASQVYVRNKERVAKKVGVETETVILEESTTEEELLRIIERYNQDPTCHGILLQSPVPCHIDEARCLKAINHCKDVDGFHPYNVGLVATGNSGMMPCTPLGIIRLLHEYELDLSGKHAVIIGRSNIVGKPMAQLLLAEDATVTICHSKTNHLKSIAQQADLLVVATGKSEWITPDYVKEGAIVVDVGMNRSENGLTGDVSPRVMQKASYMTPVPGGVGPMTIAMLMLQTILAAEGQQNDE